MDSKGTVSCVSVFKSRLEQRQETSKVRMQAHKDRLDQKFLERFFVVKQKERGKSKNRWEQDDIGGVGVKHIQNAPSQKGFAGGER